MLPITPGEAEAAVRILMRFVGEDQTREGLKDTPKRVTKAMLEMLSGYHQSPEDILETRFDVGPCDEMVVVKDIDFVSFCEHHWLPFTGTATVGYLASGKVVGLSKIPRLVDCFAKRLQVQERMSNQIVDALQEHLAPLGCGVIVTGTHSCMSCRGVRKQNAAMVTSALRGVFKESATTKAEFLSHARR